MKRVEMRMNQELGKKLLSILKEEQVKKDEPMKSHTTFRVGGPADYFVTPQTAEEVAKVIEACTQEKVPYYIVGNGSNLLVSDKGYEGVIIQIDRNSCSRMSFYIVKYHCRSFFGRTHNGSARPDMTVYTGKLCHRLDFHICFNQLSRHIF